MLSLSLHGTEHRFAHEAMNTLWEFHLEGTDFRYLQQAAQAAFAEVSRLEDLLSLYREHSDVSRINAAPVGEVLRVSEETLECLTLAMEIARITGDCFHPFCGHAALLAKGQSASIAGEWDESPADWDAAVLACDPVACRVQKLRQGPLLDFGAIGKGFALDCAARCLGEDWEVSSGLLVSGGSSLLVLGPGSGPGWKVAAPDIRSQWLRSGALGASGLGFQPWHVIDPRTQTPLKSNRRSFAHAPNAASADALATAGMSLSKDALPASLAQLPGSSLCFVDDDESVCSGPFFSDGPEPIHPPA